MTRLVLVRHGETEWSREGRHTGRTDVPLTPRGEDQAVRAGLRLASERFALVLSSPLRRAWETCVLAGLGGEVEATDDVLEWDYGAYEGRRTVEIRAERPGWSLWEDGVPGGETVEEVGRRVERVIHRARAAGGDVGLFAHAHVLRVLAARWLGLAPADGRLFVLTPASVSVLGCEHSAEVIERWNDTAHLDPSWCAPGT